MGDVGQNRGIVQDDDRARILAAIAARNQAEAEVRAAIIDASANGASVRELHRLTGMSTQTIHRWRNSAPEEHS